MVRELEILRALQELSRTVVAVSAGAISQRRGKAAVSNGSSERERIALRGHQTRKVMPLIGPLLDAADGVPNDLRSDWALKELFRVLNQIHKAMS